VALAAAGCGTKYVPVEGVVKLDGKPVEGATVVFTSEDGSRTFSGFTDANGAFSLTGGEKPGAVPGNYKVTVVKTPALKGGESMEAGKEDYVKQMKGELKESEKAGSGVKAMMPMPGAGGKMMMPPVGDGAKQTGLKNNELPAAYAAVNSTPLTVKVPPDGPVQLELKSK